MKIILLNKRLLLFLAAVIIGTALLVRAACNVPASVNDRELPIYCVDTNDKLISLSFDCAWNDSDIDDIIKVLAQYNCTASFFVVGEWAEKYRDAIKKLSEAGHEIANHSYNHAHYSKLTKDSMITDMNKCDQTIEALTGKKINLFRAPYGEYNNTVVRACTETNRFCIQWDVDSLDYRKLTVDEITNRVVTKIQSGSIILLHNGTTNTAKALTQILPKLQEQGYKFVPVSQLIYKENYTIDHTGKQIKK